MFLKCILNKIYGDEEEEVCIGSTCFLFDHLHHPHHDYLSELAARLTGFPGQHCTRFNLAEYTK